MARRHCLMLSLSPKRLSQDMLALSRTGRVFSSLYKMHAPMNSDVCGAWLQIFDRIPTDSRKILTEEIMGDQNFTFSPKRFQNGKR